MAVRIGRALFLGFFAVLLQRYYTLLGFQHDDMIDKHFEGYECSNILEGTGSEDIATTKDGLAFITTGLYYPPFSFKPKEGKIYVTDLNVSPVKLLETKIVAEHDLKLNLHGLDLIEVDDRILLYVVNHKNDLSSESIEKFEYFVETNELVWLNTFSNPALISVNDVAVISEDKFYATNDHYFGLNNRFMRIVETYTLIRIGSVAYCEKNNCRIVTPYHLAMPNGISIRSVLDKNGKSKIEVLVVYCYDTGVGVYEIGENGDLIYKRTIPAPATMDNMWVSPEGEVYLTGHPKGWKFLLSMWMPKMALTYPPGSEILKMEPNAYDFNQIYLDNGWQFIGSSIGVVWGKNVLIGSPKLHLMECHAK